MGNNWAIVVGVNHYDFLPEASLRFAVKDALAMKAFLCEAAGFPEKQVLLCGDGSSGTRKATRPILRDILLHQIQHAKDADNLWFFFSGHGLGEHLMPIDGNPNDLPDTAISIHFVTERLRACKAKNIVLVLDMCRNEHHEVGQKSAVSVADSLKRLVQEREGQQGIITLFSCGRGESSYEIASLEQGAFTHALLEGLKQQTILKELETYLARRVPELHSVDRKTRKQVPLVIPEPGWKYDEPILSHYATAIDVARLKEMAIDAECDGEIAKAIRLWEQVNLLAEKGDDRQRALNKIKQLSANQSRTGPSLIIAPQQIEPPVPIVFQQSQMIAPKLQNSIDTIPLESEKKVDYRKLRDLLKDGKWEEADRETLALMLQASNRQAHGCLNEDSLKNFPCKDLRTIDELWVQASNGHFGFRVQKTIWEECGSPMSSGKDWDRFCIRVGWQDSSTNDYVEASGLQRNPYLSPPGELPLGLGEGIEEEEVWCSFIAQRFTGCNSHPYVIDAVPLELDKGIDYYQKLRELLREGKWEEADEETLQVMLQVANRKSAGCLDTDSLEQFPCEDLRTIDQLWVNASRGYFGFSVQKNIWEECGSPTSSEEDWDYFCFRVGWKKQSEKAYVNYSDLKKSPGNSPKGELPARIERRTVLNLLDLEAWRGSGVEVVENFYLWVLFSREDL
jgi:GUN4-like/Caspase domain